MKPHVKLNVETLEDRQLMSAIYPTEQLYGNYNFAMPAAQTTNDLDVMSSPSGDESAGITGPSPEWKYVNIRRF